MSSTEAVLRRPASPRLLGAAALGAVALVVAGRLLAAGDAPLVQTFVLIFSSIVVEALPFILLGAIVSAALQVYVPHTWFDRIGRLPLAAQLPAAVAGGFVFPVCECGSIPVARRLISRGVHPAAGLTFMLASPVFNPIVLASTFVAYRGRGLAWQMVGGRAALGMILALVAGWALGTSRARDLLRLRDDEPAPGGDHDHGRAGGSRLLQAGDHLAGDLFFMGRYLVLGAAIAALVQTVVPQSLVSGIARTPLVGTLALMGIAFLMSLCSEADAFVAITFTQFPLSGQLAFLVFGPVVDAKLAFLYGATFRRHFVARLVAVATPVVLAGALWFEVLVR